MKRAGSSGTMSPTYTSLVEDALHQADDFLTPAQIANKHPDLTAGLHPWDRTNRVTANLARLRKMRVVDFMVSEGVTYWFLTGEDDRTYRLEERVREGAGSRGGSPAKYVKGRKEPRS